MAGGLGILAGVTWFPGWRRSAAVRHLRVPADAGQVMERLTDSDRRAREWRRQVEHRGELARPRVMPVRWVISERISIESAVNETGITVRVMGRMAGLSRVLYLLGYRDTTTARQLTELARLQADLTTSALAAHFAKPPNQAAGADGTG